MTSAVFLPTSSAVCTSQAGRVGRRDFQRAGITVVISHFRKDLKFVSDVEKEMEALVEAVNKVEVKTSNWTCL